MTLDEVIIHAEKVYKNKKCDAEEARLQEQDKYADECAECAEAHRQLAEWLRELKRADTLLKATYDLLNKQHGNYYVLNLLAETVYYDGAECDGNCLMEDIDAWMDERGIDYDATRD